MELTKERIFLLSVLGALLAGALVIYAVLYGPLLKQLKTESAHCRTLEEEAGKARVLASSLHAVGREKVFISEDEVALAIDELTRKGRSYDVGFSSMTRRKAEEADDGTHRVLPIEIEMESSYKALGEFLGSLEGLAKSLVTVRQLTVTSDEKDATRLKTRLVVSLYLQ